MLQEAISTVRTARRLGETSLAINKLAMKALRRRADDHFPEMLRDTMESLGATYIKLGQLIASSPTLFPAEYVEAFQTCLDQAESLPYSEIEAILEEELGIKLTTRFRHIEKTPLASASIAQVHAAQLISGEHVVLKVQKPRVKQILETDFGFLQLSTQILDMVNPKAWKSSLTDIVHEIRHGMLEECDFYKEADNIEEFARFLEQACIEQVVVPEVYRQLSTGRVLVMERFFGVPISDVAGVRRITNNPEFALAQALDTWFMSLKQCQLYHADLHAGNVMMLDNGQVGFIDFGIVGRLSDRTWDGLTSLFTCVPTQDFDALALALSKIGATKEALDLQRFSADLEQFWLRMSSDKMLDHSDPDGFWRAITFDLSAISARHGIRFPREFTLLVKQFLYFDRYIRLLAPEVDLFEASRMDVVALEV